MEMERRGEHGKATNYNTEFLIVYARDLISSIPSDQSMVSNIVSRIAAAASAIGHMVFARNELELTNV